MWSSNCSLFFYSCVKKEVPNPCSDRRCNTCSSCRLTSLHVWLCAMRRYRSLYRWRCSRTTTRRKRSKWDRWWISKGWTPRHFHQSSQTRKDPEYSILYSRTSTWDLAMPRTPTRNSSRRSGRRRRQRLVPACRLTAVGWCWRWWPWRRFQGSSFSWSRRGCRAWRVFDRRRCREGRIGSRRLRCWIFSRCSRVLRWGCLWGRCWWLRWSFPMCTSILSVPLLLCSRPYSTLSSCSLPQSPVPVASHGDN